MNILFIACYSPLINNSASIETLMYLNSLAGFGAKINLLTVNFPEDSIYYDQNILKMLDKRVTIHKIDGGLLFNKLIPRKNLNSSTQETKTSGKKLNVLRQIKNKVIFPDMYYSWSKNAANYAKELLKTEKIDVIFSMHEPPSSHLCALNIKKEFKDIPWITYWSDPWMKDSTRDNIGFFRKNIESKFEREVVKNCDRFLFVTKQNGEDFIKSYNIDPKNVFYITRGYDKEKYRELQSLEKPSKIDENKINIVYAGEIFKKLRNINPFIDALKKLKEENFEEFNKLNVLFFGNIDDLDAKDKLLKLENANVNDRIPFDEALRYMLNSQILLIFGNKNSKQIPAKIYDYFGTKAFIDVILGDENDPLLGITENNDKCIVMNNNAHDIYLSLIQSIKKVETLKFSQPQEKYEWQNISCELYKIIEGVVK